MISCSRHPARVRFYGQRLVCAELVDNRLKTTHHNIDRPSACVIEKKLCKCSIQPSHAKKGVIIYAASHRCAFGLLPEPEPGKENAVARYWPGF